MAPIFEEIDLESRMVARAPDCSRISGSGEFLFGGLEKGGVPSAFHSMRGRGFPGSPPVDSNG